LLPIEETPSIFDNDLFVDNFDFVEDKSKTFTNLSGNVFLMDCINLNKNDLRRGFFGMIDNYIVFYGTSKESRIAWLLDVDKGRFSNITKT
jgi:hypothetical protein